MASRFFLITEDVRAKFEAARAARGAPPLVVDETWLVGRLEAMQTKAPPYVAWVRGAGTLAPVAGGNAMCGTEDLSIAVQPLYTISQRVFAIVCGVDEEDTENLWFEVLLAVDASLSKHSLPRSFRWVTQEEDEASYGLGGSELVIQEFEWPMIVPAEQLTTATVTTIVHDDKFAVTLSTHG